MSDELPNFEDALYNVQQVSESRRRKIAELERENSALREEHRRVDADMTALGEQVDALAAALTRAERKLSAYVGVCTGDKELTDTVLPMSRAALAKVKP